MSFLLRHWRFVLECVLFLFSVILTRLHVDVFGYPENFDLLVLGAYFVYFVIQFKFKLGVTIPFIFIIVFTILAIFQWQRFQGMQSFDLSDYRLAISYVTNAVTGAVIYFEHKLRW